MAKLRDRAIAESPIKAPAMNITLGSVGVLSLGTALTAWDEAFRFIFGDQSTPTIRAAVLIATLAGIAIVVSADMLSRAMAVRVTDRQVVPAGRGWSASVARTGTDEAGFAVAALRAGTDGVEYLLVKDGTAPAWFSEASVSLTAPAS